LQSPTRLRAALLGAVLIAALGGASPAAHADDAAALVRAVAGAHAAAARGVVAFDVTTRTQIRGGPYHRDDLEKAAYVTIDGQASRKRVLQLTEGGRAATADGLERASAKPDGPLSRFGMRLPYATESVDAYAFDAPRAEGGGTTIAFRTNVRDEAHGDGTMLLDADRRPVRVVFHPAKLPEHVSDATVTVEFGTVGTARWDVTRITRAFSGRLGIIRGRVDSTSTYDAYRSFATPEQGNAAIDRE
jgi:hypothetical protein